MSDNPGDGKSLPKDSNENKSGAKMKSSTESSSKSNKSGKKLGKVDDSKKHEKPSKGKTSGVTTTQGDSQVVVDQDLSRDKELSPFIAKLQAENEKNHGSDDGKI